MCETWVGTVRGDTNSAAAIGGDLVDDLLQAEGTGPGGSQFERERNPVDGRRDPDGVAEQAEVRGVRAGGRKPVEQQRDSGEAVTSPSSGSASDPSVRTCSSSRSSGSRLVASTVGGPGSRSPSASSAARRARSAALEQLPRLGGEPDEPQRVDGLGLGEQPVAARVVREHGRRGATSPVGLQRLAQPPDVRVERRRRAPDLSAPHRVGEGVHADGASRLDQEERQRRGQPGPADRHRQAAALHLEGAEVVEPKPVRHPRSPPESSLPPYRTR